MHQSLTDLAARSCALLVEDRVRRRNDLREELTRCLSEEIVLRCQQGRSSQENLVARRYDPSAPVEPPSQLCSESYEQ